MEVVFFLTVSPFAWSSVVETERVSVAVEEMVFDAEDVGGGIVVAFVVTAGVELALAWVDVVLEAVVGLAGSLVLGGGAEEVEPSAGVLVLDELLERETVAAPEEVTGAIVVDVDVDDDGASGLGATGAVEVEDGDKDVGAGEAVDDADEVLVGGTVVGVLGAGNKVGSAETTLITGATTGGGVRVTGNVIGPNIGSGDVRGSSTDDKIGFIGGNVTGSSMADTIAGTGGRVTGSRTVERIGWIGGNVTGSSMEDTIGWI